MPFMVAQGAKKAGYKVVCAALAANAEPELENITDIFKTVPLARPGAWIRNLKKHGVTSTIMVGKVEKANIYTPARILHYIPDWRAFRIWYWRLRKKDKRNDTLLNAVAEELAAGNIILEDSTMYCPEHLADEGLMTKCSPPAGINEDIKFGWEIVKELGRLDIGQAITVKEREVIAVEAIEGTAAMIERTAKLCPKGKWTLIKTSKPQQDMRFDVPCVGPDTIKALAEHRAGALVLEKKKTIIIDKPQTLQLADELSVPVIGC